MKHATSRLLFAYWDGLRGERAAPERQDIAPGRIRHILADAFILAIENGRPPTFRLAGTRCSALFGHDLKDRSFASLWAASLRHEPQRWLDVVTDETQGAVLGCIGTSRSGLGLPLELLLLPLRHRGRPNRRILGALSASSCPAWLGQDVLLRIDITSARIVDTARSGDAAFTAPAELAPRLVVLDGGRPGPGGDARA